MTNLDLNRWVGLGSMNVCTAGCLQTSTWGPGTLGQSQQVVKQLSCPYIQSRLPGAAAPWQGWESAWPASCLHAWVPGEEAAHRGRQTLPFALPVSQSTHIFHVQQTVNSPSY